MRIPKNIMDCVAFVGLQMADETYRMAGTAFFIDHSDRPKGLQYAVTAKHVIEGIKSKGLNKVWLRFNLNNGSTKWYHTAIQEWIYPSDPDVDIAVFPIGFKPDFDHMFYPLSSSLTPEKIIEMEVDIGDEVFITGLFRHHHGSQRNIPIARVGNIAAMPGEKIQTKEFLMDAYLIEARSIGGLSGSPVFINYGAVRFYKGQIWHSGQMVNYSLLGLIHGHYDVNNSETDEIEEDQVNANKDRVNTGIAIVTPIIKLFDLLDEYEKTLNQEDPIA